MLKYAKIINKKTKQCQVGIGTDTEYYKSINFKELDVEKSHDGNWYLKGHTPQQPIEEQLEELKQQKKQELKQARDNYLKFKNYNLSENDKFNIMNLLDGFKENDKNNYLEFLKNDLIPKYNNFDRQINEIDINNIEELKKLEFNFIK